jgi:hypothetical protein
VRNRGSGKVTVTTRCVVVPPSPDKTDDDDDDDDNDDDEEDDLVLDVDTNNNNSNQQIKSPQDSQTDSCAQSPCDTQYTRNRSTTRSWPVIYRNNSLLSHNNNHNYLEPNFTKTEKLQTRSEQKRKSTHQYDFDQIFGLNNANYQQYLASHRKSSNFDPGFDKSPSIYDMQQHHNSENPEQTQTGGFCNAPPTVIFLLITLIMTTSATSMLCAAFLTDHWENLHWDQGELMKIVNESESTQFGNKIEFLLDGKVARLPFKGGKCMRVVFFLLIYILF